MKLERGSEQLEAESRGIEYVAIDQLNIEPLALLTFIRRLGGSEAASQEADSGKLTGIQVIGDFHCLEPGSAHHLKGRISSPPDRYHRVLQHAGAGIQNGRREVADVGRVG